jgi:hypothetical protein
MSGFFAICLTFERMLAFDQKLVKHNYLVLNSG